MEFFGIDLGRMTLHDWIGLIMTVTVFFVMVGLYFYVFRPKNRDKLESHRRLPDADDDSDSMNSEDKK